LTGVNGWLNHCWLGKTQNSANEDGDKIHRAFKAVQRYVFTALENGHLTHSIRQKHCG
jgi:hypothetical protein